MSVILFVKNLTTEDDVRRIDEALTQTRLTYRIRLTDRCVIIDGEGDAIYTAKVTLTEAGYSVE